MDLSSNERIANFAKLFAKLSVREQVLSVTAAAAILYFVLGLVLITPQKKHVKEWQQQTQSNLAQLQVINAAGTAVGGAGPVGSESEAAILQKQIADADALLQQRAAEPSTESLATKLLASNPKVSLVSLNAQPATEFYTPSKADGKNAKSTANAAPAKPIYKRSIQVALKGNYLALLGYLQNLQASPQRLFWSDAKLDASKYPDSVLNLTINILSDTAATPLH